MSDYSGWQPIETAPKNGQRVLIWSEEDGCWPAEWHEEGDYGAGWYPGCADFNENYLKIDDPTHWMPLPEPPHAE